MAYSNPTSKKRYACEIILINMDLTDDGFIGIHCHFLNYDKKLILRTHMNAEVALSTNSLNCLPKSSVVDFEVKSFVFIAITRNRFKMQEVTVSAASNGFIAISNAKELAANTIAMKGIYALLMKLKNKQG